MPTTLNKNGSLLTEGLSVDIYWNLHKQVFSVRAREGEHKGRVIAHMTNITLLNVKFHVDQKGRERVIKEKRKNVHAYIRGQWTFTNPNTFRFAITYDPYRFTSFVTAANHMPIYAARAATGSVNNGKGTILV